MILGIYGTGGSGKETFEMVNGNEALKNRWDEIIFIDDTKDEGIFWRCKMFSFLRVSELYNTSDIEIIVSIGEPKYRKKLADRVREKGYKLATIIHPLAIVSPSSTIGKGVLIQDYVYVSAEAHICDNVYINGRTIIGHNVEIGENCQVSSHSIISGNTTIGDNCFIGMASAIREHLSVGENAIISMGAIVMKDVRANKIVMGNPAREIAENTEQKVFK